MQGGTCYDAKRCPECGELMWNGLCENRDCKYHYHAEEEGDEDV